MQWLKSRLGSPCAGRQNAFPFVNSFIICAPQARKLLRFFVKISWNFASEYSYGRISKTCSHSLIRYSLNEFSDLPIERNSLNHQFVIRWTNQRLNEFAISDVRGTNFVNRYSLNELNEWTVERNSFISSPVERISFIRYSLNELNESTNERISFRQISATNPISTVVEFPVSLNPL